ncbi:hypothetical protein GCM10011309_20800 [Litorimonas cladophorae]|uniref:Lipoprotein n=1 Tax=Litorimonas cladophorae TaxID=1220491 RepID=A0A918KNK6_9PROT|nr:hypothetical protein [Litorimonas cladophorae]GGX70530.1 hypothetical protein GCM10011309_20800 [Litorimonas cladophorae]
MTFKTFSLLKTNKNTVRSTFATVSAIGLAFALSACAPKDAPKKTTTVEVPAVVTVTPAPKYLTRMTCGGVGSAAGFERSYVVFVEGGTLSFIKGTAGESGYEYWGGTVAADGTVNVEGTYEDTPGQPRDITFTGSLTEATLNLSGTRGPRECTVAGKLPNA